MAEKIIKNDKTTFKDSSEDVVDTLVKLSKSGLKAGGKVIMNKLKEDTNVRSGNIINHINQWAKQDKETKEVKLEIGYLTKSRVRKKGKKPSFANPNWLEHGTSPHDIYVYKAKILTDGDDSFGRHVRHPGARARNILKNTVMNNINEIVEAQKKYLDAMNLELEKAKGKIDNEEEEFEDE